NEEELLAGCLESISGVADEIIIVDTGSTDKTVEIAEQYTGKIYHHPWEQNFAKHRNQSIGYAGGEWILIIDADERLQTDRGTIEGFLMDPDIDAVGFRIINPCPRGNICFDSVRIFRNNRGYRYEGIVHNQLVGPKRIALSGAEILHAGYDKGEEATRSKFERTAALLKRQLEEDPEDVFSLTNLAVSCLTVEKIQDAFEYSSKAVRLIEMKEAATSLFMHAYVILLRILIEWNRFDEAEEVGVRSLRRFGVHPDILSGLVCSTVGRRDWAAALSYGEAYLRLDGSSVRSRLIEPFPEWRILASIASAHIMTGRSDQAQALFERALNASPDRHGLAIEIGTMLIQAGHRELGLSYMARPFAPTGGRPPLSS
ncbi:MAG: glycosyltransferase, partial [Deltaproteobacteria bacterium]|nr:glycosyltransferase [Deltaproteobacteria bacterium]